MKSVDKSRSVDKKITRHIAPYPRMDHTGNNVSLTVSSSSLTLVSLDTGQLIASHDMPRISFASGGDTVNSTVTPTIGVSYCLVFRIRLILLRTSRKTCTSGERVTWWNAGADWRKTLYQQSVKHSSYDSSSTRRNP